MYDSLASTHNHARPRGLAALARQSSVFLDYWHGTTGGAAICIGPSARPRLRPCSETDIMMLLVPRSHRPAECSQC